MFKISIFPTQNKEGDDLAKSCRNLIKDKFGVDAIVHNHPTQKDVATASIKNDLVIFDGSVEDGHIYHAATAQPSCMEHVLVVSRTYLPVNFTAIRCFAPPYTRGKNYKNSILLEWIESQLTDLLCKMPRLTKQKSIWGSIKTMQEGARLQQKWLSTKCEAFISYRSNDIKHIEKFLNKTASNKLSQSKSYQKIHYFKPGELVFENELLTKQQYWQILSTIDRWIGAAKELWIYDTDEYLNSWWTYGELAIIEYRKAIGEKTPKILTIDPITGKLNDKYKSINANFSTSQQKRMTRWFSNCDPATMGPEARKAMESWRSVPLLGQLSYFNDEVFSDSFWEDLILPCPHCCKKYGGPSSIENFLWIKMPSMSRVKEKEVKKLLATQKWNCPNKKCYAQFKITANDPPRFFWMPTRMGRTTGPNGNAIMPRPVYRLEPQ